MQCTRNEIASATAGSSGIDVVRSEAQSFALNRKEGDVRVGELVGANEAYSDLMDTLEDNGCLQISDSSRDGLTPSSGDIVLHLIAIENATFYI